MANKIGDVVQLKSGGPWMTVLEETNKDGKINCMWFRKVNGEYVDVVSCFFYPDMLKGKPENLIPD